MPLMDLVLKALAQAPLVAVIAYIWWRGRLDYLIELERLQKRVQEKDDQLGKFAQTFDTLALSLELLKDRIPR